MRSGLHGNQPVLKTRDVAKVTRLLQELHDKKRWLDTMIDALEAAAGSPHHQLIETTERVFEHQRKERPKVDLGPQQQKELVELAIQVARTRGRRIRLSAVG